MVNIARKKHGCSTEETVAIGDRLYTDIADSLNAGTAAECVLIGEATMEDIRGGRINAGNYHYSISGFRAS